MSSLEFQRGFQNFAFVLFCYVTNHLMTGPLGNSEFCFPRNLNVSLDFVSGNKIHCSLRDQSLSVKCCMKNTTSFKFEPTTSNMSQHVATRRNRVTKRLQHVAPNNVEICCVEMLRSFGRGFTIKEIAPLCLFKAPAKRSQHCNATDRNIVGATCCVRLATLLQRVATCCELKIELVRMPRRNIVARTWPNDYNIM